MPFSVEDFLEEDRPWNYKDFEEPEKEEPLPAVAPGSLQAWRGAFAGGQADPSLRIAEHISTLSPEAQAVVRNRIATENVPRAKELAFSTMVPAVFPKVTDQTVQNAADVMRAMATARSQEELQEQLSEPRTPPSTAAGAIAGGINVVRGVPEFMTSPVGAATLALGPTVSAGAKAGSVPAALLQRGITGAFLADIAANQPEAAARAGEASVAGTPQEVVEAYGGLGLNTILGAALGRETLKPREQVTVEPERIQDANQIRIPEEVLPTVRPSAEQVAQEVPAQMGIKGVPPSKRQALQAEVLLREEAPAPAATEARAGATGEPTVPPKTAVFNGIQMAGPSFKYFNEKTGRWNDVSAETAKQRGIEIPPEELAKAEAAQKGTSETTQTEGSVEAKPGVGEARQVGQEAGAGAQVPVRRSDVPEIGSAKPETTVTLSPEPSGQALGIVPPGTGRLLEIVNQAISKPKEAAPPIKTEIDTPFPDYNEHSTSKKIFSQPFGFERLPFLGALMGGTRRLAGHVNESISTYWAERQIGKSITSAFGAEHSWIRKPFEIKDGQITNITPAKPGSSRYIADVFEALQKDSDAYVLNTEQRKAFDAMQKLENDFTRLEKKYKIGKSIDDEAANPAEMFNDADAASTKGPYFPRVVTSRPEGVTSGLTRGSGVGVKAFFEKPRLFETEAEGWARGYKYEPDIVNRLATRAERLYKRIADKRLAEDPSLEGVGRKEVEAQLKASFAEELVSGEMTEKKISKMADSVEERGRVYSPAFFNKIFPEETANQLNKAFPKSQSTWRQMAVSLNSATKGLQLGLDMGVGFIQGQALLARHPAIWGKAQFNSVASMFRVEHFPEYVRGNLEPIRELAQLGSSVGKLEEYMAGLGGKELLSRIPGVKAVTAPFARQFQTFLDVAKVEMWKGIRETVPREQWSDAVQTIESQLFSGRMEGAGVSPGRALIERALFLAPAYYRGGLNNLALLAEGKFSGASTRKAMVAYATAGAVLYYGLAKQLGMSDEEIKQRMNPARSDFMMWRIKTKNHISNVGFGGFYRSLLRLMGNTAKTSLEHPENWKSLDPNKNPITKWYRGHAGPVVTAVWDGFSGKDYMGEDVDVFTVARRSITPITAQSARGRPGQPTPGAGEAALSFIGVQSFPVTSRSELNKLHSEWLASNPDPKIKADYERNRGKPREQSKYANLMTALLDKDEKSVTSAIKDLQSEGVKRSDIFKRMNPYTASGESQKPLFHESTAMESKFRKNLTPEQMKLYEQAGKDRLEQWRLFRKLWRAE